MTSFLYSHAIDFRLYFLIQKIARLDSFNIERLYQDHQVIETAQEAFEQIRLQHHEIESEIYLKDIASDFINFSNHLPFKLTVKLKD